MARWFGYHRVSTKDQHNDRGVSGIQSFCDERTTEVAIYCDKQTGREYTREEYSYMKRAMRPGDTLVLWELDRLGRTKAGILDELKYYKENDIRVISYDIPTTYAIDISQFKDEMAVMIIKMLMDMMIEIYATIAETELTRKKKRQKEGYEEKRARGEWEDIGRPQVVSDEVFAQEYEKVLKNEITGVQCQKNLGISESTYYRRKQVYDNINNINRIACS